MLFRKTVELNKSGRETLAKLDGVKIVRKRYNRGVGRTLGRMLETRDIPVDAPPPRPTGGWTSLEDHLFFAGQDSKGREKTYYVKPFSVETLEQMKEFLSSVEREFL